MARNEIAGATLLADSSLAEALLALFDEPGLRDCGAAATTVAAELRAQQVLAVLQAVLAARDRRGEATVLLLEDLHWIDATSEEFLDRLVHGHRGI